jgi:hypothetical protein
VVYKATFGSIFTVTPKVGLSWTGIDYPPPSGSVYFGWVSSILRTSQTDAYFGAKALVNFNAIKIKYVATQGDHLQVFFLETRNGANRTAISIPFDYATLVEFDSANLPSKVFVSVLMASFQSTMINGGIYLSLLPAQYTGTFWTWVVAQMPYANLYGPSRTFSDTKLLTLYQEWSSPFVMQFTLAIHRVNLPTETPSDTGYSFKNQIFTPSGTQTFDTTDPNYNNVAVSTGKGLTGVLGFCFFHPAESSSGALRALTAVNFTSISNMLTASSGYTNLTLKIVSLFYIVPCDASCQTCSGMLPTQCKTCPTNLAALQGSCTCPAGKYIASSSTNFLCATCPVGCTTCTSANVCTTCELNSYRTAIPDADSLCPCLPGYYEDATYKCLRCPSNLHCSTCQLSTGSVVCTNCSCSQHREKVNGACTCRAGYRENTMNVGSDYCERIPI